MKKLMLLVATLIVVTWAAKDVAAVSAKSPQPGGTDAITIPLLLNYQGRLLDSAGHPVPDGIYAVTFNMYAESTGGAAFWTELQNVQTRTGLFNVLLGRVTPNAYLPWDGNCFLEMQVHPDPAMSPRVRITSAAYAYLAARADTAVYAARAPAVRPLSPGVSNAEIGSDAVTTDKIYNHTIKGIDIAMPCSLISQVGNPGAALWIKSQNTGNGIRIDSAANNGIVVYYANSTGILVDSSAGNGINVYAAATDGIYVAKAHVRGLRVDQAGNYGVAAYGNQGGGYFVADSVIGIGVVARSFNGVAADTAIRAYGKGLASGGWVTGFEDGGEAPCVVASEQTIIATGNATIVNGFATIRYPDVFARHIRTDVPARISLTPRGNPTGMLCVSSTDAAGFRVALKTVPGWDGESNVTFDWLAFGLLPEPSTKPSPEPTFEGVPERGIRHD